MSRRALYILFGVIIAALVAVVVLLVVVIQQNNTAAERREHERIVQICEDQYADPYGDDQGAMAGCIDELKSR